MISFLVIALCMLAVLCFAVSPRVRSVEGFFFGKSESGGEPGLWTLVLSQVTTWIFARSLLNAAVLGYLFGIIGTIAYAVYYASFLVGASIIDAVRFRRGHRSIQAYLETEYGRLGTSTYNVLVALRLVSEVFANLLVVGLIFGVAGSQPYVLSISLVALVTLAYSMMGGLRASLRTDVLQMSIFLVLLAALVVVMVGMPAFKVGAILASSPDLRSPGWQLLLVALLQVWSYPMHDPVMMDRGFVADRTTTRRSFHYAFWLSTICIVAFGLLGVVAGFEKLSGEALMDTLGRTLSGTTMLLVNLALVVSAVSTLDSALSSAAKLWVIDMKKAKPTAANGRLAMAAFLGGGIALLLLGSKDLFSAVAISGTAALFLAPVLFFNIWGRQVASRPSYLIAFTTAILGAVVYFLDSAGYTSLIASLFGQMHDYGKLLIINAFILACGFLAFAWHSLFAGVRSLNAEA